MLYSPSVASHGGAVMEKEQQRIQVAIDLLNEMLDGGEEYSGKDGQISHVIGLLKNDSNHVAMEHRLNYRVHATQPNEA